MPEKVSMTNTKKEILSAYNELLEKISSGGEEPEKARKKAQSDKLVTEVAGLSVDSIIQNIAELKTNITGMFDKLEDQMVNSFKEFKKLKDAIRIEQENLEETYQITANAHSLSALIAAQEEKKLAFEQEMTEKQKDWKEEVEQREKAAKEEKAELEKQRKREEEEYQYNLKLKRKKEQDAYEEKKAQQEKELNEQKALFEKELAERKTKIIEAETELAELRKKNEEFPKVLEKEVNEAVKSTETTLKKENEFREQMMQSRSSAELQLKEQTISTLHEKIKDQEALIKQLAQKADISEESVKEIALKALESSSREKERSAEKYTGSKESQQ